jgi:hypothetical protein
MEIAWRCQFTACIRPSRDNNYTKGALGHKRRQVDLDIIDVIVNKHPWAVAWIAKEADRFSERSLRIGGVCRSDVIDDVCLDAFPRATVDEEGELESEGLSETRLNQGYQRTSI